VGTNVTGAVVDSHRPTDRASFVMYTSLDSSVFVASMSLIRKQVVPIRQRR
jgi:hypothetical protein